MRIFYNLQEWQQFRATLDAQGSLGFVPTMGNLHAGHASLVKASIDENAKTVVSIFINPTQFNQTSDFIHYPKTVEADLSLLENLQVDYCILPTEESMYPDKFHYQIQEYSASQVLEGQYRPGHFTGVLTVVMKWFNLVRPTRAYFGEKDYQQFQLIQDMTKAFFMEIEVKLCPTVREKSGLACSSRNNRLNSESRLVADKFAQIFHQSLPCEQIISQLQDIGATIEYIEEHKNRRFAAVTIGGVRLIDNYLVK